MARGHRVALALALALFGVACGGEGGGEPASVAPASSAARAELEELQPPTGPGAMAPFLTKDGEDLLLTWLEPGHRFLVSRLNDGTWSTPVVIAEGDGFFANWADVPKLAVAGDGTLWAHWLAKTGTATYAYGIFLARSIDGGVSWQAMGTLHDDATPTEHGFVSYAAEGEGLRALWLDGREMAEGGAMTLRSALLTDTVGESTVVDDRVCECCPTALATTSAGAVALYRDRSPSEVRNIGLSRYADGAWSSPTPLHEDGWVIAGCPVNGPTIDARGDTVAAAWFTVIDETPRVQIAFSADGGESFGQVRVVDGDKPLGRVSLALDGEANAWISWLGSAEDQAELRLARHSAAGVAGEWRLATTAASRGSGIPRLALAGGRLYVAWVESAEGRPSSVRFGVWSEPLS